MPHFAAGEKLTAGQVNEIAHQGIKLLEERTLETSASNVMFSNIDQSYKNLWIIITGGATSGVQHVRARFNGDSAANYDYIPFTFFGDGTTNAFPAFGRGYIQVALFDDTSLLNSSDLIISGYSRTDRDKFAYGSITKGMTSGTASSMEFVNFQGWWKSTAAITSIDIYSQSEQMAAGSIIQIFGMGQ